MTRYQGEKFAQTEATYGWKASKSPYRRKRSIPLLCTLCLLFLKSSSRYICFLLTVLSSFPLKHTVKKAGSGVR